MVSSAQESLRTVTFGDESSPLAVIVLHGRNMCADDLAPFAKSLMIPAYFVFPDAPGRTWWPVDSEARMRRLQNGPMELSQMDPEGRAEARERLAGVVDRVGRPYVLVGFSQGGMLAMDHVLQGGRPRALALLSSTRIAIADWTQRANALAGLPVLVAHGTRDDELAFRAGELLADFARSGGARVTWLPFEGGHEIPLVVWRALRKFVLALPK